MVLRPLLIVDGAASARELAGQVEAGGAFTATLAATGQEAERVLAARHASFDAVLLDTGLPDGDGRDLCARLRRRGYMAPVVMLSDTGGEDDVVQGLDAGANDYISKPCPTPVLLARLRAHLRSFDASVHAKFAVGPYTFHPAGKLLHDPAANRRVWLKAKEARLLEALCRAGGRVVDQETLLLEVWGYNVAVETRTVPCHVYRLRQKIEADPSKPTLIITTACGGYRLVLPDGPPPRAGGSRPSGEARAGACPGLCG